MKRLALVMGFLGLALLFGQASHYTAPSPSFAQSTDTCDALITQALQEIGTACVENGRNETCYGNVLVSATLADSSLAFRETGDIVPVTALEALITRPANPDTGEWGVALMDLEADLPEDADGLVRMVLFGGVEITPATEQVIPDAPTCPFTNTNPNNLNMRSGPGLAYRVVDVLNRSEAVEVYGQSEDGWLRSSRGWVFGGLGDLDCAEGTELLTMNDPASAYIAPMQAFSMTIDDSGQCRAAPPGLLIQTPDRSTANIIINNVEIRAGSTALITGNADTMVVANIEGNVKATVDGVTANIPQGAQVEVPVDENGTVNGPVSGLRPIQGNSTTLDPRILDLLPQEVDIPQPAVFDVSGSSGNNQGGAGSTPGQWLGCGSCSTCGHPSEECVTSPDGACVWDPATCTGGSPTAGIVCSPTCAGTYQCPFGDHLIFNVTYISPDDEEIDSYNVFSTPVGEPVNIVDLGGSANTFSFKAECITFGVATVTVQVLDTAGISYTKNFNIQGVAP